MKVNFASPMLDHKSQPIPLDDEQLKKAEAERKYATLQAITDQQLLFGADPGHDNDQKMKADRFALWRKIGPDAGEVDLVAEDIALLKRLIGHNCPPLIMGRCFELLDPKAPPAAATVTKDV